MHRIISAFLIVLGLGVCGVVFGQSGVIEISAPQNLTPHLLSLIRLTEPDSSIQLDRAALAEVLKFVKLPKDHSALYYTPFVSGVSFVYYELEIQRNFEDILKFGFSV